VKDLPALRRWYYTHNAPVPLSRYKADLSQAITQNRRTLALVTHWLDDAVYQASIFQYGLQPHIRAVLDQPIDDSPTYSDLIVHLAREMGALRYLELGPSVGKNLFQVAKAVHGAAIVAVDIEDINPILEQQLSFREMESWPTAPGSKRKALSTRKSYALDDNSIDYIAGDLFDPATWERLRGRSFNLIFSDAFHSPEALAMEWDYICRLELLTTDRFAMVWDDLSTPGMRAAFYQIAGDIRRRRPAAVISLELFAGWVGRSERLHPIGIIRG